MGGTNFIGPRIINRLREKEHSVTVFHRGNTEHELSQAVPHIHGDFANLADFKDEFRQLQLDVLLYVRAIGEADMQLVTDVFRGLVPRLVMVSSCDVYQAYGKLIKLESGEPDLQPLNEDASLRSVLYPYKKLGSPIGDRYDKILAERIALNDPALPGTVLRLPMVYGPGDFQHRLFYYIKHIDDKRPAILLEETQANWRTTRGYVDNVAEGVALAVADERAVNRIYNIADAQTYTEAEWVQKIGAAMNWSGKIVAVAAKDLPPALAAESEQADMRQHLALDTSRIRQELGYTEVVAEDEGLRRTIEWERANPPAEIDPAQYDYAAEDTVLAEHANS